MNELENQENNPETIPVKKSKKSSAIIIVLMIVIILAGINGFYLNEFQKNNQQLQKQINQLNNQQKNFFTKQQTEQLIKDNNPVIPTILNSEQITKLIEQTITDLKIPRQPIDYDQLNYLLKQSQQIEINIQNKIDNLKNNIQEETNLVKQNIEKFFHKKNPYPLIKLLESVNLLIEINQYQTAIEKMNNALSLIDKFDFDLTEQKQQLIAIKQQYKKLSEKSNYQTFNQLLEKINNLPIKSNKKEIEITNNQNQSGFLNKIKNIFTNLFNKLITVKRNDKEDTSWLDESAAMQSTVRANIRLQLLTIKNLFFLQQPEQLKENVKQLIVVINKYFDNDSALVKDFVNKIENISFDNQANQQLANQIDQVILEIIKKAGE